MSSSNCFKILATDKNNERKIFTATKLMVNIFYKDLDMDTPF